MYRVRERDNHWPGLFLKRVRKIDELVREGIPLTEIQDQLISLIGLVSGKFHEARFFGLFSLKEASIPVEPFAARAGTL